MPYLKATGGEGGANAGRAARSAQTSRYAADEVLRGATGIGGRRQPFTALRFFSRGRRAPRRTSRVLTVLELFSATLTVGVELITSTLTPTGRLSEEEFAQLEASRLAGVPLAAPLRHPPPHDICGGGRGAGGGGGGGARAGLGPCARSRRWRGGRRRRRSASPSAPSCRRASCPPRASRCRPSRRRARRRGRAWRRTTSARRCARCGAGCGPRGRITAPTSGRRPRTTATAPTTTATTSTTCTTRACGGRARFWAQRAEVVPTAAELETLWVELCRHISAAVAASGGSAAGAAAAAPAPAPAAEGEEGEEGGDNRDPAKVAAEAAAAAAAAELAAWEAEERSRRHGWLNYDDFTRALAAALPFPSKREAVGGARLFLSLHLDAYGRARATLTLHRAACAVAQLLSTRIDLAALDPGNTGRLDEPALESFVQACVCSKIRRLAGHSHLRPGHSFEPFYVAHCTRKLLLALGGRRRCGWVSVEELLRSPQLSDLFSLCAADDNGDGGAGAAAESALEEGCWFSLQRAIKVYRKFLEPRRRPRRDAHLGRTAAVWRGGDGADARLLRASLRGGAHVRRAARLQRVPRFRDRARAVVHHRGPRRGGAA